MANTDPQRLIARATAVLGGTYLRCPGCHRDLRETGIKREYVAYVDEIATLLGEPGAMRATTTDQTTYSDQHGPWACAGCGEVIEDVVDGWNDLYYVL